MSIELKIKSKHLALESKVIRFEENKLQKRVIWLYKNSSETEKSKYSSDYWTTVWKLASLSDHRKNVVGRENRATFLARAYIAGKPYSSTERSRNPLKEEMFQRDVLPRVYEMVKKYHDKFDVRRSITVDTLKDWSKIE